MQMEIDTGLGADTKVVVVVCALTSRRMGKMKAATTRQRSRGGPAALFQTPMGGSSRVLAMEVCTRS